MSTAVGLSASLPFVLAALAGGSPIVFCDSLGRAVLYDYGSGGMIADSGRGWSYSFEFPPVEPGLEFLWAEAVIDVDGARTPFKSQAESYFSDHEPESWEQWIMEGGMSLLPSPDGMATAMCEYWVFTGGAHGMNNTILYRYALTGGPGSQDWVEIDSRDLLADSAELVRFSRIVCDTLEARLGPDPDMEWIQRGAGPYWENYSMLYPVPDSSGALAGFTVMFPEYGVGPYCFGQQEVFVPLSLLRP
ncbi:MAG TPA: hypothetical protein PK274_10125 [Candidatus Fermentibacter daniensis]|nr:hypothetical protein [Candidatus Fermentibacter daniensis]